MNYILEIINSMVGRIRKTRKKSKRESKVKQIITVWPKYDVMMLLGTKIIMKYAHLKKYPGEAETSSVSLEAKSFSQLSVCSS